MLEYDVVWYTLRTYVLRAYHEVCFGMHKMINGCISEDLLLHINDASQIGTCKFTNGKVINARERKICMMGDGSLQFDSRT